MFRANGLFYTDGYKIGHAMMLVPNTKTLYGTWIPRSLKYVDKRVKKVVSFGQQYVAKRVHDIWTEDFFNKPVEEAVKFANDMSKYLGLEFDGSHFVDLHNLGYLPFRIKALKEGTRTLPNIPHMTFVNTPTNDGKDYAWLTLYLETQISFTAWKLTTSATLAYEFRKTSNYWTNKTDPNRMILTDWMCHDFSARGLSEVDNITSGLGHIISHRGTDSLLTIPASRYYYGVGEDEMPVDSVCATEHSISCVAIFYNMEILKGGGNPYGFEFDYIMKDIPTVNGEYSEEDYRLGGERAFFLNLILNTNKKGILSYVSDTFSLWDVILRILLPFKEEIIARDGTVVIRPDSGNPIKILCGDYYPLTKEEEETFTVVDEFGNLYSEELFRISRDLDYKGFRTNSGEYFTIIDSAKFKDWKGSEVMQTIKEDKNKLNPENKGVFNLLWEIFDGEVNEQGYKVLDTHIKAIYGDSINLDRQSEIYRQMEILGFASTNSVLGIGSYTYQMNTRDTLGWAVKGSYFEVEGGDGLDGFDIYKDPITDDGTKKSLKGLMQVYRTEGAHGSGEIHVKQGCTWEEEGEGLLRTIYENGKFYNETTLEEVRKTISDQLEFDLKYKL